MACSGACYEMNGVMEYAPYSRHEIVMSDKGVGKWLPYDLDGEVHECKTNSTGNKKVETKTLSLEEINARLKRVESIGIGQRK